MLWLAPTATATPYERPPVLVALEALPQVERLTVDDREPLVINAAAGEAGVSCVRVDEGWRCTEGRISGGMVHRPMSPLHLAERGGTPPSWAEGLLAAVLAETVPLEAPGHTSHDVFEHEGATLAVASHGAYWRNWVSVRLGDGWWHLEETWAGWPIVYDASAALGAPAVVVRTGERFEVLIGGDDRELHRVFSVPRRVEVRGSGLACTEVRVGNDALQIVTASSRCPGGDVDPRRWLRGLSGRWQLEDGSLRRRGPPTGEAPSCVARCVHPNRR